MIITWHGEGCFRLQNGETSLLIDPPEQSTGITAPRFKTDILLKTLSLWPAPFVPETNADVVIAGAGEYDVRGIVVRGFELSGESTDAYFKTIYTITWDDVVIGVLGHVSNDIPPALLEHFEELDVLIVPAGGAPFFSIEKVFPLLKMLTPKVVIPSFTKVPGLKRAALDIKKVVEQFSGESESQMDKFVFKKKDLLEIKKTKMVCLTV